MQRKSKFEVKAGDVFGRLTLTGNTYIKQFKDSNRTLYEARCECGDVRGYQLKYLIRGDTKSCGCYRNDMISQAVTTHNISKHPLYQAYQDIKRRCYDKRCKSYPDYGGRGIYMCSLWLNDIMAFYNWGLENGWEPGLEIDRRNNDGIYEPDNCRFVTREEGNKNTRRNIMLLAFGEKKCAADWLRDDRCKIKGNTLKLRLSTGWDIEEAITTPPNELKKEKARNTERNRLLTVFGETKCATEWSEDKRCKVSLAGLKSRLKRGWSDERAVLEIKL